MGNAAAVVIEVREVISTFVIEFKGVINASCALFTVILNRNTFLYLLF